MHKIHSRKKIVKEFIKVKPRGFFFHEQYFTNIDRLIEYFKNQQHTQEY